MMPPPWVRPTRHPCAAITAPFHVCEVPPARGRGVIAPAWESGVKPPHSKKNGFSGRREVPDPRPKGAQPRCARASPEIGRSARDRGLSMARPPCVRSQTTCFHLFALIPHFRPRIANACVALSGLVVLGRRQFPGRCSPYGELNCFALSGPWQHPASAGSVRATSQRWCGIRVMHEAAIRGLHATRQSRTRDRDQDRPHGVELYASISTTIIPNQRRLRRFLLGDYRTPPGFSSGVDGFAG